MDPTRNPFAPGAGAPPPELSGRQLGIVYAIIWKKIFEINGKSPQNITNAAYFINKNARGEANFYAKCSTTTPVHLCDTFVSSDQFPGLEIEYDTRLETINEWTSIQSSVTNFADSLVVGIFDIPGRAP